MFSDLKELRVKGPAIFFNLRRTYRFLGSAGKNQASTRSTKQSGCKILVSPVGVAYGPTPPCILVLGRKPRGLSAGLAVSSFKKRAVSAGRDFSFAALRLRATLPAAQRRKRPCRASSSHSSELSQSVPGVPGRSRFRQWREFPPPVLTFNARRVVRVVTQTELKGARVDGACRRRAFQQGNCAAARRDGGNN